MFCIHCGVNLPDFAAFCPECSTRVSDVKHEGMNSKQDQMDPNWGSLESKNVGTASRPVVRAGSAATKRNYTWILIVIAASLVSVFAKAYVYSQHADTSTNAVQYDGNGFSMIVPVGSTPVDAKRETKELGGQQVTESWYDFRNKEALYTIAVGDFSDRAGGTPEEAIKSGFAQAFDPGYHMTNSASHLGILPAACAEIDGARGGRPAVAKACATHSADRKRSWMVVVAGSPDWRSFPLEQANAFMDSIQIK